MRRKYIGSGNTPIPGDYCVINVLTKELIVQNRTEEDAGTIAQAYNHQYCQPNFENKYFVKHKSEL